MLPLALYCTPERHTAVLRETHSSTAGMSEPRETFRELYERVKDEPIRINTFRIFRDPQARTEPHVIARELPAVSPFHRQRLRGRTHL